MAISIENKVELLIKNIIEENGYELYDIEYKKEGKDFFLRIYIDKEKGINLDDCEKVHYLVNDLLDKANYIKDQYFLEISSSGIEKVLKTNKHLEKYLNELVNVKLFKKDENGKKEYSLKLISFNDEEIVLEGIIIPRKNITQIKNIYNW